MTQFTILTSCGPNRGTVAFIGTESECHEYVEREGFDEAGDRMLACEKDSLEIGERAYIVGDRAVSS